jgi:hypothetical protein
MIPTLFCYQVVLAGLVWLFFLLYWLGPTDSGVQREHLMRPRPHQRRPHHQMGIVHLPLRIGLAQAMGTLDLGRMAIFTAIERYRIVGPLVLAAGQRGRKAPAPAHPAHFLPHLR